MTNGQNLFQFGGAALFGGVDEFPPPVIDVVTADHFTSLPLPWVRPWVAMYSLATRFSPSRSGVIHITSAMV